MLDGSPHGLNVERAEEFNRAVLDFVAQAEPSAESPASASSSVS